MIWGRAGPVALVDHERVDPSDPVVLVLHDRLEGREPVDRGPLRPADVGRRGDHDVAGRVRREVLEDTGA